MKTGQREDCGVAYSRPTEPTGSDGLWMEMAEVMAAVQQAANNKMLTCQEARNLADRLGVTYVTVGRACDRAGVRLRLCQQVAWCCCAASRKGAR